MMSVVHGTRPAWFDYRLHKQNGRIGGPPYSLLLPLFLLLLCPLPFILTLTHNTTHAKYQTKAPHLNTPNSKRKPQCPKPKPTQTSPKRKAQYPKTKTNASKPTTRAAIPQTQNQLKTETSRPQTRNHRKQARLQIRGLATLILQTWWRRTHGCASSLQVPGERVLD